MENKNNIVDKIVQNKVKKKKKYLLKDKESNTVIKPGSFNSIRSNTHLHTLRVGGCKS